MVVGAVMVFGLILSAVPAPLVLPVFAALAFLIGCGVALFALYRGARQQNGRVTCWDVASTCVFVGFAAGVLSDPGDVVQYLSMPSAR
ncbi:hypothetical protein [Terrihabitans sp. B22-R8]|uniref:hypothetical protein n=1 Tax=Terrihabitans sp. B22-R8 TaxID=3425128 RepID=UPI00403D0813